MSSSTPDTQPPPPESVLLDQFLHHRNNLTQKERIAPIEERPLLAMVKTEYERYIAAIDYAAIIGGSLDSSVSALSAYLALAKDVEQRIPLFNWRSGYGGSIIPEFLYRIAHVFLASTGLQPLFSTNNSVVEVIPTPGIGWAIRRKNQDLLIGIEKMTVSSSGEDAEFVVPLVATEVKTNIDINKLNGLDFSAERLKRSFPAAKYFIVTETIDFSLTDNYAAGYVDEMYVLRKQVRSVVRRAPQPLQPTVFKLLLDDILSILQVAVRARGHVYDRLPSGRLIHG